MISEICLEIICGEMRQTDAFPPITHLQTVHRPVLWVETHIGETIEQTVARVIPHYNGFTGLERNPKVVVQKIRFGGANGKIFHLNILIEMKIELKANPSD